MRTLPIEPITDALTANRFLLGIIFNQATKAERAWQAPKIIMERLGTNDLNKIISMNPELVEQAIGQYPAVHPFINNMTGFFLKSCALLVNKYDCDARNIWSPNCNVSDLISKLTEFSGIGKHKAIVGIFMLTVELGVIVYDDGSKIDIAKECPALSALYWPFDKPMLILQ
jgi:uncharacterized HhH-GPD family protein